MDPDTGALGGPNGVVVAGIEHKMGLKGATCTMSFEHALAYPLQASSQPAGTQRKSSAGMSGMFDMMNSARLGTGLQALSSATRAYGHAADYARERLAGRAAKAEDRTGGGGTLLELRKDVVTLLSPFTAEDVKAACARLRLAPLFDGYRDIPALDLDALASSAVALGDWALRHRTALASVDINPLMVMAAGEGVMAVDAVVELKGD